MKRTRTQRQATDQGDLFEKSIVVTGTHTPSVSNPEPDTLSGQEVLSLIPKASFSNVEKLCGEVLKRELGNSAVPALEALWNRFRGYGLSGALPEQKFSLKTLARIGTPESQAAITKIVEAPSLPDALLPLALRAAVEVKLALQIHRISPWLDHGITEVRALAYTLLQNTDPPVYILETGLSDPEPSVRMATRVTMGKLGHKKAKKGLLADLEENPTCQIVLALAAIADEDVITHLGRCALKNGSLKTLILDELLALEDPRAVKVVGQIKSVEHNWL